MDRLADPEVGAAAAEVAGHGGVDVSVGRVRLLGEERGRGHDLAGLAVAALGDPDLGPGELDGMRLAVSAESLDRRDALADGGGDGGYAGADRLAVDVDRAGAALGDAAAEFGSCKSESLAQRPEQWRGWIGVQSLRFAIDGQRHAHGGYGRKYCSRSGSVNRYWLSERTRSRPIVCRAIRACNVFLKIKDLKQFPRSNPAPVSHTGVTPNPGNGQYQRTLECWRDNNSSDDRSAPIPQQVGCLTSAARPQ